MLRRSAMCLLSMGAAILCSAVALAQNYPSRAIRIVTSPAGTAVDFAARVIAQGISEPLGQSVFVENRPAGVLPGQTVASAPADGYTLLSATNTFILGNLLEPTPYDPITDFAPITHAATGPNILVATASLPAKSVGELVALAKAKPLELNYGSTSGGSSDLGVALFMAMTGAKLTLVPYANNPQKVVDVVSGRMQLTMIPVILAKPLVQSGKLKALAITSLHSSPVFPQLPSLSEAGVPGFESISIYGLFAKANTPTAIVNRLNQEMVRYLRTPDAKQKFLDSGLEVVASTPEEFTAKMKSEITKWAKVMKDFGITPNNSGGG